jgi:long-chain acyl-CoA synthetase
MTARLTQGLRRAAQVNARGTATICGERRRSWGEVQQRIARLAGALRGLGVAPGDRVAILALNGDRYFEAYYAVPWAGGVIVPLNTRLAAPEIAAILQDCGAGLLLVDAAFLPMLDGLGVALRAVVHLGDDAAPAGLAGYEALIAATAPVEDADRQGRDLAGLFYTGGSTGRAKGVMLGHDNLVANAVNACYLIGYDRSTVYLHAASMCYLTDGMSTFAVTMVGGGHVFIPRFEPAACLDALRRHAVTNIALVPTMITMLLDEPDIAATGLPALRQIMFGSSPIPEATLRRATQVWPEMRFLHGWGMTELSPIGTMLPHDARLPAVAGDRLRSCGQAVPNAELRIVDAHGQEVPRGTVGEIVVRGPIVMQGYWNRPQETAAALRDGWLHTGDAATMDEDGFVCIVDRLKDMVISGGENVYTIEVESAISLLPGVAQVAVIGIPDPRWGEAVHAIVVPREGAVLTEAAVRAHCRGLIAGYKTPRSVEIRAAPLPISGAGKVMKAELRAPHWSGRDRQVG